MVMRAAGLAGLLFFGSMIVVPARAENALVQVIKDSVCTDEHYGECLATSEKVMVRSLGPELVVSDIKANGGSCEMKTKGLLPWKSGPGKMLQVVGCASITSVEITTDKGVVNEKFDPAQ